MNESDRVRFWSKVDICGKDECWPWTGGVDEDGYGQFRIGSLTDGTRRMVKPHRVSWEEHNGEIPEGLGVLHKCDNPPCCNPCHLFPGTATVNAADRDMKGRRTPPKGNNHSRAKLTEEEVIYMMARLLTGRETKTSIASDFGVSPYYVSDVWRLKTWSHLWVD